MKNIVKDIFCEHTKGFDYIMLGNKMIIKLDNDRRIEVGFYNTHSSSSYDALRIVLISKTHGEINKRTIKFSDLFDCMQDLTHPNKIGKHIWYNDNKYSWYGKPTRQDIVKLQKTLEDYIDVWQ